MCTTPHAASPQEGRAAFVVATSALPEIAARIAAGRAQPGGDQFLAVPLPGTFDPLALLRDPAANHVVASYERPDRGLALVGVGEAARVEIRPGEDPQSARTLVAQLLASESDDITPELRP